MGVAVCGGDNDDAGSTNVGTWEDRVDGAGENLLCAKLFGTAVGIVGAGAGAGVERSESQLPLERVLESRPREVEGDLEEGPCTRRKRINDYSLYFFYHPFSNVRRSQATHKLRV